MLCSVLTAFLLLHATLCTAQDSHAEKELRGLTEARRNHSRLAVVSAINNNASAPQYVVVGYEEAKRRDPSTPKFRPDPMPKVPHYPQLVTKNSSGIPNLPKGDLPQVPNRPIIEKNKPLIFEKSKFEIINEYLEERISNLTIKVHNSNYECGNNGGGGTNNNNENNELLKLRKRNEELSYKNKVLEAENVLLSKMVNNNGSYVKIVSNQPLKPVHCFEIENKYRMCEANKHTLQSSISNLLNMNKNFPTTIDTTNCTGHTDELKKCLTSVEECFEESESTVKLLHECEIISNKNLDQLEEVEKDVLRLNLDNKFVTQQIIDVNNGYSELKNVTLEFYNKIFDYAINIQEEGKFNESLKILDIILEARTIISGPDDPETITVEHEIAFLLNNYKIARYDEAHKLFTQVLEKRRRIFGDEHPDTLLTLYNVADVMRNLRRNAMYYQEYLDAVEPSHSYRDNSES